MTVVTSVILELKRNILGEELHIYDILLLYFDQTGI